MAIRKKQRLFILAYTNRAEPKTFEHGTNSALLAGYTLKRAASTASWLLKKDYVKQEIARISQEWNERFADTLENKIRIAWDLFMEARTAGTLMLAQKWYEEHGKLSGHYSQNINFKDKTERTTDENKEISTIRQSIFDVTHSAPSN